MFHKDNVKRTGKQLLVWLFQGVGGRTEEYICINAKTSSGVPLLVLVLAYQDSNLDKQNQNLLCCHYTISQTSML